MSNSRTLQPQPSKDNDNEGLRAELKKAGLVSHSPWPDGYKWTVTIPIDELLEIFAARAKSIEREAEGRGRVSVLSDLKEWADDTEVTYNLFIEAELEKVANLRQQEGNDK